MRLLLAILFAATGTLACPTQESRSDVAFSEPDASQDFADSNFADSNFADSNFADSNFADTSVAVSEGMIHIPAGQFTMGSPSNEPYHNTYEVAHEVTLTRPFFISETEITQGEYEALIGANPSIYPLGDNYPVAMVSWFDAVAFANARSIAEGFAPCYGIASETVTVVGGDSVYDCEGFRLPTEAEWEYAARANTTTPWFCGSDESCLGSAAWYLDNADGQAHVVGSKVANTFGLHDTMGNVAEWCWDEIAPYEGDATDPTGPDEGSLRTLRGGNFANEPRYLRSAYRDPSGPSYRNGSVGFRLVRTAQSGVTRISGQ